MLMIILKLSSINLAILNSYCLALLFLYTIVCFLVSTQILDQFDRILLIFLNRFYHRDK